MRLQKELLDRLGFSLALLSLGLFFARSTGHCKNADSAAPVLSTALVFRIIGECFRLQDWYRSWLFK